MKCDEIFAALAMLEKERGIPQDFMMNKIVQALTTAYKRDHEGVENVVVEVNEEKRDLKMFVQKEIVEEVENPGSQISLEEAVAEVKLRSRQYAKRQLTWFRRTEGAKWLFWGPEPDFEAACRTSTKYLEEFGLV